jgi:hypothetical protein
MKKVFFVYAILLVQNVVSQTPFSFGIRLGSNYNLNQEVRNNFSFVGGAVLNYKTSAVFRLQTEVLYAEYSSIREFYRVVQSTDGIIGLLYDYDKEFEVKKRTIQMPILGQYTFAKKIKTEFGPQLGYVLDGKLSAKEGDDDFIESAGPIITKMESQFDIGVILGLGYELTDNFDLTARFYSGIIEKDNIINLGISLRVE